MTKPTIVLTAAALAALLTLTSEARAATGSRPSRARNWQGNKAMTFDGRLAFGPAKDNPAKPNDTKQLWNIGAQLFRPEALLRDGSGYPAFWSSVGAFGDRREIFVVPTETEKPVNAMAVCNPDPAKAPFRCNGLAFKPDPAGDYDCYRVMLFHNIGDDTPMKGPMMRATVRAVVKSPATSQAELVHVELEKSEAVAIPFFNDETPKDFSISADGRLMVYGAARDGVSDVKYHLLDEASPPCSLSGWSAERRLVDMYCDPEAKRYPLSHQPLSDAAGKPFVFKNAKGETVGHFGGGYAWLFPDGSNLMLHMVRPDCLDEAMRAGTTLIGRATGYTAQLVDGPLNHERQLAQDKDKRCLKNFWMSGPDQFSFADLPASSGRETWSVFTVSDYDNTYSEVVLSDGRDADVIASYAMTDFLEIQPKGEGRYGSNRVPDSSGHRHTASLSVGAEVTRENVAAVGRALRLSQPGARAEVQDVLPPGSELGFSLSLSLWPKQLPKCEVPIAKIPGAFSMSLTPAGKLRATVDGKGWSGAAAGDAPTGEWQHAVLGFDGKTGAIGFYVGGKRVVAATVAPGGLAPVNAKLTIGDAGECGDSFVGLVDQVELRKAPLSPQQVCELAGRNASCDGAAPRIRFRDAGTNLQVDITDEDGLGEEAVQRSLMVWIGGQHQPPLAKPVLLSNGYRLTIPKNALVVAGLARILEVRVVDERGNRAQNAFDGSFVAQPNQSQPGAAPLAPPTTERLLPGPDPQLIALTALAAIAALMSRRMRRPRSRAIAVGLLLAAGCWSEQRNGQTDDELDRMRKDGQRLFETGEFGGNGRHCSSCHPSDAAFTITPAYVQQLFATNPDDPLFDEAAPIGPEQELASKLLRDGALLPVTIALPQGVEQVGSTSRTAILYRGVPTVRGVARTAPYLRDGRARTLEDQAKGAVETHMGGTISDYDAKAISEYERSLVHAPVPPLDDRGKRGEALFLGKARCAACHHPSNDFAGGRGVFGWQFARVLAPDPKDLPVPMRAFRFASEPTPQCQKPPRIDATTTDPGRAAVTGAAADLHHFDIPSLRGIRETAPYFHNNSAGTLPEVVKHYDKTFNLRLSSAEQSDLVGYLEAL